VPEENFWTLWCKGRLTEADTQTIRLGATPSGLTSAHLHHPLPLSHHADCLNSVDETTAPRDETVVQYKANWRDVIGEHATSQCCACWCTGKRSSAAWWPHCPSCCPVLRKANQNTARHSCRQAYQAATGCFTGVTRHLLQRILGPCLFLCDHASCGKHLITSPVAFKPGKMAFTITGHTSNLWFGFAVGCIMA